MHPCAEVFWRILFEMLKYSLDNFIFVILVIAIISAISKNLKPMLIGLIAFILDRIIDWGWYGTAGLSSFLSFLIAIAIGVLWAMMILNTDAKVLIKGPNAFFLFICGFTWGIIALPIPVPLALIVAALLQYVKILQYTIAIIFFGLFYLLFKIANPILPFICSSLNSAIRFFS